LEAHGEPLSNPDFEKRKQVKKKRAGDPPIVRLHAKTSASVTAPANVTTFSHAALDTDPDSDTGSDGKSSECDESGYDSFSE